MSASDVQERLKKRLDDLGMSARSLAARTGDDEKNVQRWVHGKVKTVPADFIGRCHSVGLASAVWLLTGTGPVMPPSESEARTATEAAAFRKVAGIILDTVPNERDAPREDLFEMLVALLEEQPGSMKVGERLAAAFNEIQAAMDQEDARVAHAREIWEAHVDGLKRAGLWDPKAQHRRSSGAERVGPPTRPTAHKGSTGKSSESA